MTEAMKSEASAGTPTAARTVADATGLLVELARACKGLSFYGEGHPARTDLIDRAWMAWRLEVQRAGRLDLTCERGGLRIRGLDQLFTPAAIDELHHALLDRDVEALALGEDVTRESFAALLDLLGQPPEYLTRSGGLALALAQRCDHGIGINGQPLGGAAPSIGDASATSLGSGLLVSTRDLMHRGGDAQSAPDKPAVDDDPLGAPGADEASETLRRELLALDGLSDDDAYEQHGLRLLEAALEAFARGRHEDGYRTVLVFCDHAIGEGGRSARQARLAHEATQALCTGAALDEIIDRACASDVTRSVRASRVLLQLGAPAADRVLVRITDEPHDGRAGQLRAILTALGEHAREPLERALEGGGLRAAATAARLCGDTQNPSLVPALALGLRRPDPPLQRAAIAALTQIGGTEAGDVLLGELARADSQMIQACCQGLAQLGEDRFVLPMLAALDRAERRGDGELAVELVRALGRLGSERAVPRLASMLRRRRLLARSARLELQARALETLAELPGREARRTVEWTARSGPRGLRQRAKSLLGRADVLDDDPPRLDEPSDPDSAPSDATVATPGPAGDAPAASVPNHAGVTTGNDPAHGGGRAADPATDPARDDLARGD